MSLLGEEICEWEQGKGGQWEALEGQTLLWEWGEPWKVHLLTPSPGLHY